MISSAERRRFVISCCIIVVFCVAIVAGIYWTSQAVGEHMARKQTEIAARMWENRLLSLIEGQQNAFATGELTDRDKSVLTYVTNNASDIYRHVLLDMNGRTFWSSNKKKIGKVEAKKYFRDIIAQGEIYIETDMKKASEIDGLLTSVLGRSLDPDTPRWVTEIYIPVMKDGRFVGAIELYRDTTEIVALYSYYTRLLALVLSGIVATLSGIFIFRMWHNARQRVANLSLVNERQGQVITELGLRAAQETVLSELLALAVENTSLEAFFSEALDLLTKETPWLESTPHAGIFVSEANGRLRLACEHNLAPEIKEQCAFVDLGHCLCGRAALMQKIQFSPCVDDRHDVQLEGIDPHGHYNVPLLDKGLTKGVLVLHIQQGHEQNAREMAFLTRIAQVFVAGMIKREYETALKKALAHADAANVAKSSFLARMSHEIRTPLNGLLGMAEILTDSKLNSEQRGMLEIIMGSGEALLRLINDLLDLSRIEAGEIEIEAESFDIEGVIKPAESLFTVASNENDISFSMRVEPEARGSYIGDAMRVRQIVLNLVANAVKFTEHGSVVLRVSRGPEKRGKRSDLIIAVEDTGIGIPSENVDQLFEPFKQGDEKSTRRFGGVGLGLAICKELSERMGGRISVETEIGKGSIFTLILPLERADHTGTGAAASGPVIEATPVPAPSERPLRILAAEDNETNRLVLKAFLAKMDTDVDVDIVENGREAVNAWQENDYDVILMDIQMPVLDGMAATCKIREAESQMQRTRTPIVALSADAMAHEVEKHLGVGMDAHVAKPIRREELFKTIAAVVGIVGSKAVGAVHNRASGSVGAKAVGAVHNRASDSAGAKAAGAVHNRA